MKFGDTLYRRSVPKWAAYNLHYNELKRLIKSRTSTDAPTPVPIPGQTDHRWSLLEDELFDILKEQYDGIGMFLRSKYGEIERRLTHLDRTVKSTKRQETQYTGKPSQLGRKYQKLAYEAENISEDIQALSRFATAQKTAFRKILKKYRKWTNSDALKARLEVEVFSDGQLELNISDQMQHLAAQTSIINRLEAELLQTRPPGLDRRSSKANFESPVTQISQAAEAGPLHFDAAIASVPFGEIAGTASYWIHTDDLDEARVLLLRYMRDLELVASLSRQSSNDSISFAANTPAPEKQVQACYFDNVYRFVQDTSTSSPSRAALCTRWSRAKEAVLTMSDMSPRSDSSSTISIKRKDVPNALNRDAQATKDRSASSANVKTIKDFLSQHRDLVGLASQSSVRSRYAGLTNSVEVGSFAVLDTDITYQPFDKNDILSASGGDADPSTFPHAVLTIRWEFGKKPEVVRAFDASHLAERVADFSLEAAAVRSQYPDLIKGQWVSQLDKDIRKVPISLLARRQESSLSGTASGPSSTGESVFSAPQQRSAGSDTSPVASMKGSSVTHDASEPPAKKKIKRARIAAESPDRQRSRYYSEYDDPDSELYQQETYTIYVDPNAELPGMATLRKIVAAFSSLWPLAKAKDDHLASERTSLLNDRSSQDDEGPSSESDSEITVTNKPKYKGLQGRVRPAERYRQRLSRRQRAFERTVTQICGGLLMLSYVLLFMSAMMLSTGRRKTVVEVDAGATVGVVMAFASMLLSSGLVWMRKTPLSRVEKVAFILADATVVLISTAVVVGIVQRATHHKPSHAMVGGVLS